MGFLGHSDLLLLLSLLLFSLSSPAHGEVFFSEAVLYLVGFYGLGDLIFSFLSPWFLVPSFLSRFN